MAANSLSPSDDGRVPDDESMRGHPIIDRAEAIQVIRTEHNDLAMLVMFLTDALRDGMELNHPLLRQRVAAEARRALLERETALITLGGDDYQEPPEWDWQELLDAIANDVTIGDLERAFNDESEDGGGGVMPATVTQTSVLAVTMPKDLAERIKRLAEQNDRTVKAEIRVALRRHVERQEDIDPAG